MMLQLSGRRGLKWRMLPAIKLAFSLVGRGWHQFYAWMLDRQERNNTIGKILDRGAYVPGKDKGLYDISRGPVHAAFLKANGLNPAHRFLDFGCGYGRTAATILDYLETGNYVGVDLSAERIRICHDYIKHLDLEDRHPTFVANRDNALAFLDEDSIDVAFATSVFSHMPFDAWKEVLSAAHRVLRQDGAFILNYHISETGPRVSDLKDYYYPQADVTALFTECGFVAEGLHGWHDDLDPANRDADLRVVKLTIRQ